MGQLLAQLFTVFAPVVADIIRAHHAQHGTLPTDAEIRTAFEINIETFLAEGAAWEAAHQKQ